MKDMPIPWGSFILPELESKFFIEVRRLDMKLPGLPEEKIELSRKGHRKPHPRALSFTIPLWSTIRRSVEENLFGIQDQAGGDLTNVQWRAHDPAAQFGPGHPASTRPGPATEEVRARPEIPRLHRPRDG